MVLEFCKATSAVTRSQGLTILGQGTANMMGFEGKAKMVTPGISPKVFL